LLAAIWTIVATFGPLAYVALEGRLDTDLGHFALPAALFATRRRAGLLGVDLCGRSGAGRRAMSDYAARNLRPTCAWAWRGWALGSRSARLSIYSARRPRVDYEDSLKARAGTIAAMLDETTVRNAFGADFNARGTTRAKDALGRTFEYVYVDEQTLGFLEKLGRQLVRFRRENRDVTSLWLFIAATRLFVAVDDWATMGGQRGRLVLRYLTAEDFRNFATNGHLSRPNSKRGVRDCWLWPLYAMGDILTGHARLVWGSMLAVPRAAWARHVCPGRVQIHSPSRFAIGGGVWWVLAMGYRLRRTEREQALQRAEQALAADRAKAISRGKSPRVAHRRCKVCSVSVRCWPSRRSTEPHRALVSAVRSKAR